MTQMTIRSGSTSTATVYSALVVLAALAAALAIRTLGLSGLRASALYMSTPAVVALLMTGVLTRDGRSREGWASLGLHRSGLRAWGLAVLGPLAVSVVATALVWATPYGTLRTPAHLGSVAIGFVVGVALSTVTVSLGEELGWRGYLLPRLMPLGSRRALLLVGLVWFAWHLPLIVLTPLYHPDGDRWVVLPLLATTLVAGSFAFGYLRLRTGSVWPPAIAHSVHNVAWGTMTAFTTTSSPVVVEEYLAGDNGLLVLAGSVPLALLLARWARGAPEGLEQSRPIRSGSDAHVRA